MIERLVSRIWTGLFGSKELGRAIRCEDAEGKAANDLRSGLLDENCSETQSELPRSEPRRELSCRDKLFEQSEVSCAVESSPKRQYQQPKQLQSTNTSANGNSQMRSIHDDRATLDSFLEIRDYFEQERCLKPKLEVCDIGSQAGLHLPGHAGEFSYSLMSKELPGVETRSSDDYEHEIAIGLDFGTSTVKAVVSIDGEYYAVPFVKTAGIRAYLLPAVLYADNSGRLTLSPTDKVVHQSLKLALMTDRDDVHAKARTVAFLALVLRQIRSWLYTNCADECRGLLSWEARIGYPSTENDEVVSRLWSELLCRAWILSEQKTDITPGTTQSVMKVDREFLETLLPQFRAIPEVLAETEGFIRNRQGMDAGGTNWTLVDIGSGTLDIATFAYSRDKNGDCYRTLYKSSVSNLGTTSCHHRRLFWLETAFLKALWSDKFSSHIQQIRVWVAELRQERQHALRNSFVDSFVSYASAIQFQGAAKADGDLQNEIHQALFKTRYHSVNNFRNLAERERIHKMPVLLCGGGARSKFFLEALKQIGKMDRSYSWTIPPEFITLDPIRAFRRQGLSVPIKPEDHDRLLVAYGLAVMIGWTDIEEEGQQPVRERDYSSNYVDKDQM